MLLKYGLGEENAAKRIEAAVLDTLNRGFRTGDIYLSGAVSIYFWCLHNFLAFFFCLIEASVMSKHTLYSIFLLERELP